jgi:hypothetical protein
MNVSVSHMLGQDSNMLTSCSRSLHFSPLRGESLVTCAGQCCFLLAAISVSVLVQSWSIRVSASCEVAQQRTYIVVRILVRGVLVRHLNKGDES